MPPVAFVMNLTVVQISEVTEYGSVLVKMRHSSEVETALGTVSSAVTYYMWVVAEGLKAKVDDVVDLDLNQFVVVLKDWVHPETGEAMKLKYLYLKQ